jgi:O-antigen/teichoic acid export membrane protein
LTDARQIVANTGFLAAARVIERLTSLALTFLIARSLGASGLGTYTAALAVYYLVASAGELGVTNLLVREIAKDPSRTNRYLVHLSAMAAGAAVVLTGGALVALSFTSSELGAAVAIVMFAVCARILNTIQEAVFVAHHRVLFQTYATFGVGVLNLGAASALLATGHGVVSLLAAFAVIQYFLTGWYFLLINRSIARLRWEFKFATARALISELKTFTAMSVLGALFARPEIIILTIVAGTEETGYYAAALKVIDVWYFIPQTLMVNVFPVLSRSYHLADQRAQAIQDTAIRYLLAIVLPICAVTLVTARPIVETLYGPGFEPAVIALRLLSLNLVIYSFHSVFWRVLAARGEQGRALKVQLWTILPRLGGGVALCAWLGSLGAAITMPLSLGLHTFLLGAYVRRDGTRIHAVRVAWRFALAALATAAVAWIASRYVSIFVVAPVAVVSYVVFAVLFGAVSATDYAQARRLMRSAEAREIEA